VQEPTTKKARTAGTLLKMIVKSWFVS